MKFTKAKIHHLTFADHSEYGVRKIFFATDSLDSPELVGTLCFEETNSPEPKGFAQSQKGRCYSMSVGDVVETYDKEQEENYYLVCCSFGWVRIPENVFKSLVSHWRLMFVNPPEDGREFHNFWRDTAQQLARTYPNV